MNNPKIISRWKQIPIDNKLDIWVQRKELSNYRQYLKDCLIDERRFWFGINCKFDIKITFNEILDMACTWSGTKVERTISIIDEGNVIRKYQRIKEK